MRSFVSIADARTYLANTYYRTLDAEQTEQIVQWLWRGEGRALYEATVAAEPGSLAFREADDTFAEALAAAIDMTFPSEENLS